MRIVSCLRSKACRSLTANQIAAFEKSNRMGLKDSNAEMAKIPLVYAVSEKSWFWIIRKLALVL